MRSVPVRGRTGRLGMWHRAMGRVRLCVDGIGVCDVGYRDVGGSVLVVMRFGVAESNRDVGLLGAKGR